MTHYLAVGTKKGAFVVESVDRSSWEVRGPYLPGQNVMHMSFDPRSGILFAAGGDPWFGPHVWRSSDLGRTWDETPNRPKFSEDSGQSVEKIWEIVPGRASEPGVVYAGIEPASLFRSDDNGDSWRHIEGLNQHPTVNTWNPSAGGLCLHSITLDGEEPNRLFVAVSAGGFYGTKDTGASWQPLNQGVRAAFLPEQEGTIYPESGQCVHRVYQAPAMPNRLYQQNHCGVYRSDDRGESWIEITGDLPSDWGLAMAIHPSDPDTVFVCQGTSQMLHWAPEGKFEVYRSRDAGATWQRLDHGLPGKDAFVNVLREGLCVDSQDPCGVYVGANTGQLWASSDEGDSWSQVPGLFPPISSVSAFSA